MLIKSMSNHNRKSPKLAKLICLQPSVINLIQMMILRPNKKRNKYRHLRISPKRRKRKTRRKRTNQKRKRISNKYSRKLVFNIKRRILVKRPRRKKSGRSSSLFMKIDLIMKSNWGDTSVEPKSRTEKMIPNSPKNNRKCKSISEN